MGQVMRHCEFSVHHINKISKRIKENAAIFFLKMIFIITFAH